MRPPFETFKNPTCRGSYVLGTACGHCEKCAWERSQGAVPFVSPGRPPEGRERELIEILIEECAEVQQRATKALRFGLNEVQPGQQFTNAFRLGGEMGDLIVMIELLQAEGIVSRTSVEEGRVSKGGQLARFIQNR
jgi:hypothetical protein